MVGFVSVALGEEWRLQVEKVVSGSLEMAEGFTVFRTEMEEALANKSNDYSNLVGKLTEITNKVLGFRSTPWPFTYTHVSSTGNSLA